MPNMQRQCQSCHSTEDQCENDGYNLNDHKLTLESAEFPAITFTVCGQCWQDQLAGVLVNFGVPAWLTLGWASESDAVSEGWDPARPTELPD